MSTQSAELQTSESQSLERERIFDAFRRWGYLDANLYPFGNPIAEGFPELRMKGAVAEEARRIYCGAIGVEFIHIPDKARREWVQERMESPEPQPVDKRWLAERFMQTDHFEQILETRPLGTTLYSGAGITSLIPLLDTVL